MGWRPPPTGRPRRAARIAGLALVAVVAVVATAAAGFLLSPLAVAAFVRSLQLAVNFFVWFASMLSTGADAWTIASTVLRGVSNVFVTSQGLGVILGLVFVGGSALYGLQRLLGSQEESSR
jgi:hypothetical protein